MQKRAFCIVFLNILRKEIEHVCFISFYFFSFIPCNIHYCIMFWILSKEVATLIFRTTSGTHGVAKTKNIPVALLSYPNQNLRQIGQGVSKLWSEKQTNRRTDKQRLHLYSDTQFDELIFFNFRTNLCYFEEIRKEKFIYRVSHETWQLVNSFECRLPYTVLVINGCLQFISFN